ncbi:MAG: PolC-type DNA polymerase III, partial [Clostridia bacterium]|nr:PolC-type DNA polymerase III [Clostridia bacterium]
AFFTIRSNGFDATYMADGDKTVCAKYRELKAKPSRSALEDDILTTLEICHEFYKRGFTFLPIDIYKSEVKTFKKEDNALRLPFTSLPGLGETAAQSICDERQNGEFISGDDVIQRCDKVSKAVIEALFECGAMSSMPKTNQLDLFSMM